MVDECAETLEVVSLRRCGGVVGGVGVGVWWHWWIRAGESWVGWDGESALLVRWTEDASGSLTGVMQLATLQAGGAFVESHTWSVSGVRGGSAVTLKLKVSLGTDVVMAGDIDGEHLILFWPSGGGRLDPVTLAEGTVDEFNRRVADLEGSAAQVAVSEAQLREATAAVEEAQRQLDSARWDLGFWIGEVEAALSNAEHWLGQTEESLEQLRYRVEQVYRRVDTVPALVEILLPQPFFMDFPVA